MNTILAGIVVILLLALPAAASDYTLAIFGNANEDDTINMQDVTYTELIILEYRDETELADGKHDEKINMRDVTQIELVIPGKEKELTMIDDSGRIVTVNKPITRIVALNYCLSELLVVIGAKDEIVGVESRFKTRMKDIAEAWDLMEVQTVGTYKSSDYEQVLELKPDIIITVPGRIELKGSSLFRVGILDTGINRDFRSLRPRVLHLTRRRKGERDAKGDICRHVFRVVVHPTDTLQKSSVCGGVKYSWKSR